MMMPEDKGCKLYSSFKANYNTIHNKLQVTVYADYVCGIAYRTYTHTKTHTHTRVNKIMIAILSCLVKCFPILLLSFLHKTCRFFHPSAWILFEIKIGLSDFFSVFNSLSGQFSFGLANRLVFRSLFSH